MNNYTRCIPMRPKIKNPLDSGSEPVVLHYMEFNSPPLNTEDKCPSCGYGAQMTPSRCHRGHKPVTRNAAANCNDPHHSLCRHNSTTIQSSSRRTRSRRRRGRYRASHSGTSGLPAQTLSSARRYLRSHDLPQLVAGLGLGIAIGFFCTWMLY